jgi:hypothetical protein
MTGLASWAKVAMTRTWLAALGLALLTVAAYGRELAHGGGDHGGFGGEPFHATLLRLTTAASAAALVGQFAFGKEVGCDAVEEEAIEGDKEIWREELGKTKKVLVGEGRKAPPSSKSFTLAQVSKHNTLDDCWIVVNEQAFDITRFVKKHPGGFGPILNMAGKDGE